MSGFIRPWDINQQAEQEEKSTQSQRSLYDNFSDLFSAASANFDEVRGAERLGDLRSELMNSQGLSDDEYNAKRAQYVQEYLNREDARKRYLQAHQNLVDDDSFLQNLDQFGGTAEGMIAQAAGTVGGAAIGALASPFTAGGSIALGAKIGNAAGAVVGAGYDANSVALQAEEEVLDAGGTWEQAQQAKSEAFKKAALTTLPETLVDIALGNRLVRAGLNSNLARKVANSVLGRAGSAVLDPAAKLGTKAAFASGKSLVGRGVGLATDIALQGVTEAGQEVTQDYIANREVAKALGQQDNEYSLGGFVDYARSPQGLETMKTAGIMGSVFGGAGGVLSSGQYLQRGAQTNTGIKVHNTTDKLIGNGTLKLDKQARAEEEQRLSVLTGISLAELSTWSDADIIAQASVTDGEVRNLIHMGDEDNAVSTVRESADIISRLEQTDNKNAFRYGEIRKDSALNQYLEELGIDESDRKNWFSSLGEESIVEKVTQTENKQNNQTEQNGQKKTILKGSPELIQSVRESENQAASEIYDTVGSEYEPTVIDMSSPSNVQEQIKSDGTKVEKIEPQIGDFVLQPSDRYEDSYDYRNTKTNRLFRVEKNNGGWSVKDITDGENDTETVGHTFNSYKDARNYLMSNNSTETKVYQKADNAGLKEKLGEGDVNAEEGTSGQLANSVDDLYNYMTQNPGVLDPFVFSEFVKLKQRLGTDNVEFHLDMSKRGYVKDAATGQYGRVMGWADKNESTGRAIIQLYKGADLGTAIHEIAHIGYWNLSEQDRKTFDNYAVKSSGRFIADILGEEYNDDFIQRLKNIREDEDLQNRINEKDVTAQVRFLLNSLNKQELGIGREEQIPQELMKKFLEQRQQAIEERWAWEFSAWYVEGYSKGVEPSNIKDRILDRACWSMESELNALQKIWEHLHGQDSNIEQIYRNINTNGQNANWTQNEVEKQVEQQQIQESGQIEQQPVQATPQEQVVETPINNGQQTISNPYVNENPYVNSNTGTSTIYDTSNQGQNFNNENINEQQNTEQINRNIERASANRKEESQLNLIMNDETAEIFADEALKRYDNDIEQIKSILRQKYKKAKSKKEKNWITKIVRIAEQKYRKMKKGVATNQNGQNTNNNQNYNQEYGINGNQPVGLSSQNTGELSSRNNGYFNPNPLQLNPAIQQEEQTSTKQEPQKENVEKPVKQVEQQVEQTEEEYEEDYEDIDDRIDEIFDRVQSIYKYDLDEDSQEYIKEDTDEIVEIAQNGNYNTVKKLIEHCTKKVNGAAQSLRSKKGKEAANKETAIYNTCYYSALKEKLNDVLSGKEKTKEQENSGIIDKVKDTIAEQLGETSTEENASAESMSTGFNNEQDEIGERIKQADRDAVSAYKQINTNLKGKKLTSENEVDMSNLTKEQRDQLKKIREEYETMSSADEKRSKYKTKQEKAQEFVSMEERDEQQKKIEQNKEEIKEFGEEQERDAKRGQQMLESAFPNRRFQFADTEAWQGTIKDFDKFTLSYIGKVTGSPWHGWGLYFTRQLERARYYTHISHHNTIERDMQRRESEGEFKDRNPKSSYHINVGGEAIRFDNTAREDFDEMDYYRLGNKNEMNVITQNALESFLGNIDAELDETDYEIQNLNKENQRKIIEKALRKTINELEKNDKDIMYDKRKYWEEMGDSTKGYYLDKNETLSLMYDILNKFKNDKNYISVTNYDNPRKTDYSLNKYIYKVSIPSEKYMIDYRIPYSKQSDYIKKRLIKSVSELKKISLKEAEEFLNEIEYLTGRNGRKIHIEDGEAIYGAIREEIKNQLKEKENIKNSGENLADKRFRESNQSAKIFETADRMTSELLLKNGIEGVSYFTYEDGDAYVIFNADAVKILSKLIKRPLHDRFEKTEVKSDSSLTEKQQKRAERKLQEKNNAMFKRRYMIGAIKREMQHNNRKANVFQKLQTVFKDVFNEKGISLDYARSIYKRDSYTFNPEKQDDYNFLKAHYEANKLLWDEFKNDGGFFLGLDGKWKFWFSDKGMKINIPFDQLRKRLASRKNTTSTLSLGKLISHDLLFKYYPELKDTKIIFEDVDSAYSGSYNPKTKNISVNTRALLRKEDSMTGAVIDEDFLKETLLHEIQHAIQDIEGFAQGGSLYDIFNYDDEIMPIVQTIKNELKKSNSPVAKRILKKSDDWRIKFLLKKTIDFIGESQIIKELRKKDKNRSASDRAKDEFNEEVEFIKHLFDKEYEPFLYYVHLLGEIESQFTGIQVYSKDGTPKDTPINNDILSNIGEREVVNGIMSPKQKIIVRKNSRRYMAGTKEAKNSPLQNIDELENNYIEKMKESGLSESTIKRFSNLKGKTFDIRDRGARKFLLQFIKTNIDMFRKEGIYRGLDGEWRFWISDKNARFNQDINDIFKEAKTMINSGVNGYEKYPVLLGDILTHTKLFKYYPQLKDLKVYFVDDKKMPTGQYQPREEGEECIVINMASNEYYKNNNEVDKYGTMNVLLHEIQHAIQYRNALASGASSNFEGELFYNSNINNLMKLIRENKEEIKGQMLNGYQEDVILFNGQPVIFGCSDKSYSQTTAQINGIDFLEDESEVLYQIAMELNVEYNNGENLTKSKTKNQVVKTLKRIINDNQKSIQSLNKQLEELDGKTITQEEDDIISTVSPEIIVDYLNSMQKQLDFAQRLFRSIKEDNVVLQAIPTKERINHYNSVKDSDGVIKLIENDEKEIRRILRKAKKDKNSLTEKEKRQFESLKDAINYSGIMQEYYSQSYGEAEAFFTGNKYLKDHRIGSFRPILNDVPFVDTYSSSLQGKNIVVDNSSNKRFMKVGYKGKNQTILTEEKEKKAEQFFRKWANKNGYDNEFIDKYFNQKDLGDEVILDRKDKKINSFIEYIDKFNKGMIKKYGIQRELDGRWSYELDDSNSKINDYFTKKETLEKIRQKGVTGDIKLEKILKHDELYKLYPHLKDINVVFLTDTNMKNAFPNIKTAVAAFDKVNNKLYMNVDKLGKTQNDIRENIHNNLLHEIQHSIQHFEGFAEGFGDTTEKRLIRENKMLDDYFKKTGIRNYGELSYKLLDLLKNYGQALRALAKQDPNTYSEYLKDLNRVTPNMYNLIKNHPDQVIRGFIHNDTKLKNAYDWMNGVKYIDKSKNTYNALIKPLEDIRNLYSTTLGEINARKSAGRRKLTAEQRKTVNTENLNEARMNMPRNKKSPILIKGARRYQLTKEQLDEFEEMDKREEREYNKRQERIEKADNAGELSDQVKDVYSVTFTKSAQNFAENRTRMEYFDNRQKYWDRSEKDGKVTYTRKTPFSHHQKVITYNGSNEFLKEQRKKSKPEQWLEWVKDQIIKYAFNDMHFLAKAARRLGVYNAYVKMAVTKGYALKANTAMQKGIKYNGKYTRALNDIIKEIGEEKQNEFIEYCIAKRIVDLSNRDVPVYQDMKPDEAKELIKKYESGKDAQLFMKNQKDFVEYNIALLHILVDSGIHTEEEFQNLIKNDPNFVPLTKVMDDADMGFNSIQDARSIVNIKTPLKRIGTSFRKVKNPFLEMQKRTAEYYAIASRNKAGQIFVNEIAGALEKNAKGDMIAKGQGMIRKVKVDEKDGSLITKPDDKQQIIYICNNGKHEFYQVSDPEIYRALKALDADQMGTIQKMIDPFLHAPSALIRETATMVPDFGVRNLLRDGGEAFITSEHGFIPFIDQIWGMYQMANNTEWYQRFLEQQGEYGTYNRDSANDGVARIEDTIDEKVNPIKNFNEIRRAAFEKFTNKKNSKATRAAALLELMGSIPYAFIKSNKRINDYLEMGTRIGEFKNAKMGYEGTLDRLSKGGILDWGADINKARLDDILAAGAAKEITLNFGQHGIIGKQLNRYIPFFNATLQGIYKMCNALELMLTGTTLSGEKNHKLQSELLFKAALVTAIGIGVAAAGEGDDDYEEANQYEKENFWILPNGLRFPKDQVLGKLFGNVAEKSYAQWRKGKFEPSDILKSIIENFTPDKFMPAMADIALGGLFNYDTFYKSAIVPEYMQGKLGHLQKDLSTSNMASDISNFLWKYTKTDVSAKRLDWALQKNLTNCKKYIDSLYDLGKQAYDPKSFNEKMARGYDKNDSTGKFVGGLKDDIPKPLSLVTGTFATNRTNYKSISDFYEKYNEYKKLATDEASMSKEEKRQWKRYEQAYKKDMVYRKQLRAIKGDNSLTGKQKREKADKIFKQQIKLAKWAEG